MDAPTSIDLIEQEQQNTAAILDNITTRMDHVVTQNQAQSPTVIYDTPAV
jgi:hypothetical protein